MFSSCKEDRVAKAYTEKLEGLKSAFHSKNLRFPNIILIQVFKKEGELEVWVDSSNLWTLYKTYKICKLSGTLGRKLKEGDKQVPEGFYHIEKFNPQSDYHLSLGINYPNDADKFVADSLYPGSDIFIHGNCVSIGCMAMTDEQIKEIYLLALEANKLGQINIPVNIYPFRMTDENFDKYSLEYPEWKPFWETMKSGYWYFNYSNLWQMPKCVKGKYLFIIE